MVWWGMIPGWSKALKADTDSYWNPNDLPLFLGISSFNLTQDPLFPPDWQSPKPPPSSLSLVPCKKPVNGCFSWPISLEWSRMWTFTTFLKIHCVCVHNILLAKERERENWIYKWDNSTMQEPQSTWEILCRRVSLILPALWGTRHYLSRLLYLWQ